MRIDTIVTDMDDTLLGGESELTPYTLRVMAECKHRGIRLIPASGRTSASMRPFMDILNTGAPYIGGNGSELIGADHQIMEQLTLEVDLAREIIAFLTEQGCYVHVYHDTSFYYAYDCEAERRYKASSKMRGVAVGDLCAFLNFRTPKVLAVHTPEMVEKITPLAAERFAGRAIFTTSKPYFLEAEPPEATKGKALKRLAERMGDILPERTLVFGDSLNDISMCAFTPNSVAMGNAREELKRVATYICRPNVEDGVARFVEEHVLNA